MHVYARAEIYVASALLVPQKTTRSYTAFAMQFRTLYAEKGGFLALRTTQKNLLQ